MDVILHLGAHRTATTSLQRMMGAQGTMLAQRDVAYWGPKRTRAGLCHGLLGPSEAVLPWQVDRARRRIAAQARSTQEAGARTLFISDENILGAMHAMICDTSLYPGAGARVARFAQGLKRYPLTLGLAIRSYETWWRSMLAFQLLRDGPLPTRDFCKRIMRQPRRWPHVIADLAQAMPEARLLVWRYEEMAGQGDHLVKVMTRRRGLPLQALPNPVQNIGPDLAQLTTHLHGHGLDTACLPTDDAQFSPFDTHQRRAFAAQYAEDLAWLSAGAGGLAQYIGDPASNGVVTRQGRGRANDGPHPTRQHFRVAGAREQRA